MDTEVTGAPEQCAHDKKLAAAQVNGLCRWCHEDLYRGFASLAGMRQELFRREVSFGKYADRAELATLIDGSGGGRCRSLLPTDDSRRYRCKITRSPHEGQCTYHRNGGAVYRWWGANPRPDGWLGDLSPGRLQAEVTRLRELCDRNGIDWRPGAEVPR
jgi:hypothetical protein